MNVNKLFYLRKINIAKLLMVGCVFLFAFLLNGVSINAKSLNNEITILESTYTGNGNSNSAVTIENDNGKVSYIQGIGVSNKDGIKFKIGNVYDSLTDFSAFSVWESYYTSSEGEDADYDTWYLRTYVCQDAYDDCLNSISTNPNVVKHDNKVIASEMDEDKVIYYLEKDNYSSKEQNANFDVNDEFIDTIVDFTRFFTHQEITYTYRIRTAGIGYKGIQINYWKANTGGPLGDIIDTVNINYGLARAINDVNVITNYNDTDPTFGIACGSYNDMICIDYDDHDGDASYMSITPKGANIYLPVDILYEHKTVARNVIEGKYVDANTGAISEENKVKMEKEIVEGNNLYSYNYFCESESEGISPASISWDADGDYSSSCSSGQLRKYIYTGNTYKSEKTLQESSKFVVGSSNFVASKYHVEMMVDTRGNFVVIIKDMFGNINNKAVITVMDILNQSILTYFEKSNSTGTYDRIDGWKANEYLTNETVDVRITMIATTIVKVGFPIVEAKNTPLTPEYVSEIGYWRVNSDFTGDICSDEQGGASSTCAVKPTDSRYVVLYDGSAQDIAFGGFEQNTITVHINSNGRYRFYIEASTGNTNDSAKGENKNPRVEVYKIDKQAPEVYFGGQDNSYCDNGACSYVENTYPYYQGTGSVSGSILDFTNYNDEAKITYDADKGLYYITYNNRIIYYVSADDKDSLTGSSVSGEDSVKDIFFKHMHALVNSGAYVTEVIRPYQGSDIAYAYYYAASLESTEYKEDTSLQLNRIITGAFANENLREEAYRNYIINNNIKYTAFSLAINPKMIEDEVVSEEEAITVDLYDGASSDTKICAALGNFKLDLNGDEVIDQYDCANYYLDHGLDFVIKITSYDIIEQKQADGTLKYVRGNFSINSIRVDVQDTTAPGYNEELVGYNKGTDCRIEMGNTIGVSGQNITNLLDCYNVTSSESYNFEDNAFEGAGSGNITQNNDINDIDHVSLYILNRETGKWVSLNSGSSGYVPNRSGNYALLIVIRDDAKDSANITTTFNLTGKTFFNDTGTEVTASENVTVDGNAIATVVSYYVDKRIVLISPESNEKDYGEVDPLFTYCVHVNQNNTNIAEYLNAPFKDMNVFTQVGCATLNNGSVSLTDNELQTILKGNKDKVAFSGNLTRQESDVYNDYHFSKVSNDYVGLYKIVLGTLNITGTDTDGYDLGEDYIIKIDPRVRSDEKQLIAINKVRGNKCNLVDSYVIGGNAVSECYSYTEDDDFFVESSVKFTIKQVMLTVTSKGSSKNYGSEDTNYSEYNSNEKTNTDGYLEGLLSVSGLKTTGYYSDTRNIVKGVLRREVGEDVGIYDICNYRGDDIEDTSIETINNMLVVGQFTCDKYNYIYFPETLEYKDGIIVIRDEDGNVSSDFIKYVQSRALYISPNKKVNDVKTLNVTTNDRDNEHANYVINYIKGTFTINPVELIVQPAPGQRREYNYNGVDEVNPWEVVIYNQQNFSVNEQEFNGFTANSPTFTASANDEMSIDTPDSATYDRPHYNNASEDRENWKLTRNGVTYEKGIKKNETYTLLTGRLALVKDASSVWVANADGTFKNMNAGWYNFAPIKEGGSTLQIATTSRNQCSYSDYKTTVGIGNNEACRNYDIVLDLDYRDLDGDTTRDSSDMVYMSKLGYCMVTSLGNVSDIDLQCSSEQSKEILFEVYRREIILEFNSLLEEITVNGEEIPFVYGQRYSFYESNLFAVNDSNTGSVENNIFYCYATYKDGLVGVNGDCTNNKYYGLTDGDNWSRVGLEFHLHSLVKNTYYDNDDQAIPAGRYYVYSSISDNTNYKYNYLGGTLTIKTKTVTIAINSYEKEYGNVYYDNVVCLNDGSLLSGEGLIEIEDCNDYGFVIYNNRLDPKDTIKDNFDGRPLRKSKVDASTDINGLQENVGIYLIEKGSIVSKHHGVYSNKACADNFKADETNCVVVSGVKINNYMVENDLENSEELTYYLLKNGTEDNEKDYASAANKSFVDDDLLETIDGNLTINAAYITITVDPNQTKMYGCAYNSFNSSSQYYYSYTDGYSNCVTGAGSNYDLGYKYTVVGDKDYYIFNNGYYDTNYDVTWEKSSYSPSKINDVNDNSVVNSLWWNNSLQVGSRSSALNGGVLYRISSSGNVNYNDLIDAADKAQELTHYQGQSVGKYIITLGNLNASNNLSGFDDTYNKVCDASNVPGEGNEKCRNYIINYYGNSSVNNIHQYSFEGDNEFTITERIAFVSSKYNSKVFGNDDPYINNYGLTIYTVKDNSLAKAPWVAKIDQGKEGFSFGIVNSDDVHEVNNAQNIIEGDVTRYNKGANNGRDDDVGIYQYDFSSVITTAYSSNNYKLNFSYRTLYDGKILVNNGNIDDANAEIKNDKGQPQAVNENGGITETVGNFTKPVAFEISLRKITVTLISFAKVYGIEDHKDYYDLGICATGDERLVYDAQGNPKCVLVDEDKPTEHGLAPTIKSLYLNNDGTLKQKEFKNAFNVYFLRMLGENVVCHQKAEGGFDIQTGTLNGYFPAEDENEIYHSTYTYALGCNGGYEALAILPQTSTDLAKNYEITYTKGVMSILPRNIEVTPDSNQGFQYGSYTYPSLVPAITFTNKLINDSYKDSNKKVITYRLTGGIANIVKVNLDESITETDHTTLNVGLVNKGEETGNVCLKNIDNKPNHVFCINDRQDTYEDASEETTSVYGYNYLGEDNTFFTYVFGDVYKNEESSRHALDRVIEGSLTSQRYNRNVSKYIIVKGDLVDDYGHDKTGNYTVKVTEGVEYTITPADVVVTPDTDQEKTYGYADKELTFTVVTTYKVNSNQYLIYDEDRIIKVVDSAGNEEELTPITVNGKRVVLVGKDSTITLNGYAYYENASKDNYNYGLVKNSNKSDNGDAIAQLEEVKGKSFDTYCYNDYVDNSIGAKGAIDGCSGEGNGQSVYLSTTTKVLVGYLYVTNYNQYADDHEIVRGLEVANNEFGDYNYVLRVTSGVTFKINPREINLYIKDVTKTYGQSTDAYKCDNGVSDCSGYATLSAQDNEGKLEYNFDVSLLGTTNIVRASEYDGELRVLLVDAINNKYYTINKTPDDKNNALGIRVARRNVRKTEEGNDIACTINSDIYGCEDAGEYELVLIWESINEDADKNYILMIGDKMIVKNEVDLSEYVLIDPSKIENNRSVKDTDVSEAVLVTMDSSVSGDYTDNAKLTINKRSVDIYVNTNLSGNDNNYYEIEQNVEVPKTPDINNDYNLLGYALDTTKPYHGYGNNAMSTSASSNLESTYTNVVWGGQPTQVRTGDALVGELAYCNEAVSGSDYPSTYPNLSFECDNSKLVYNSNKRIVNTNTSNKFIVITRDSSSNIGLKIRGVNDNRVSNVDDNIYEETNYTVKFYPGAVHVVGDEKDPILNVGVKDYYIEANAKVSGNTIIGSYDSIGTILEYLLNGTDNYYVLASVKDGNLYITVDNVDILVTKAGLETKYGGKGVVSGVEETDLYPFVSDYAHVSSGNQSYLNETNIKSLQELITTLIKWFNVESYDAGQYINGQYLPRKFDRYYYVAINKTGYDIGNDISNEFAINKVGTYNIHFYVMDNAGKVSSDGNMARLHIVDTTAPSGGELTLYNGLVKCDEDCNNKEQWYIGVNKIRLASFNKYSYNRDDNKYYLDNGGEYIKLYAWDAGVNYVKLDELPSGVSLTTENYIDYLNLGATKFSAEGIVHYGWNGNETGIYLTITGGKDNSYHSRVDSQWKYYYSLDNIYYLDYILKDNMQAYSALLSDGERTIYSSMADSGVKVLTDTYNDRYEITYDACYGNCLEAVVLNKVTIGGSTYTFTKGDISRKMFNYDEDTVCTINDLEIFIDCVYTSPNDGTVRNTRVSLEGNRFKYNNINYVIVGDNIFPESVNGTLHTKLIDHSVTLNGVSYRFDKMSMKLYRDYELLVNGINTKFDEVTGEVIEVYTMLELKVVGKYYKLTTKNNTNYICESTSNYECISGESALVINEDGSFKLTVNGKEYEFTPREDVENGYGLYYLSREEYDIVQDSFKVGSDTYNISQFVGGKLTLANSNVLKLINEKAYTNTYTLYDSHLAGLNNNYSESSDDIETVMQHRAHYINNVAWNTSVNDDGSNVESSVKEEIYKYLYQSTSNLDNFKYYSHSKVARLDTRAPIVSSVMTHTIEGVTQYVYYGREWYIYEHGYYNLINMSNREYLLRGITYTVNNDNTKITTSDSKEYILKATNNGDDSRFYVYQKDYVNYYIDKEVTTVKWLYSYIDEYVGVKDLTDTSSIKREEIKSYNLSGSIRIGKLDNEDFAQSILLTQTTNKNVTSGIGSSKYLNDGVYNELRDYIQGVKGYGDGVYYEDVDYIVLYKNGQGNEISINLNDEFKQCYLDNGKITIDCAQEAISSIVVAPDNKDEDITYTINYIVRDKAGNASSIAAKGVLYASIRAETNVVVNPIEPTNNNSGVSVVSEGDNTYKMNANQGVSLELLNEAFSVDYKSKLNNYNSSAVMTIYKDDELIYDRVSGVAFTYYINSDEIADYTIVYDLNTEYKGEEITGETITLKLSISSPHIYDEDNEIKVDNVIKNESNVMLFVILIGFISMIGVGIIFLSKRRR